MVGMRLRRGYAPAAAKAAEVDLRREEADDFAAQVPVDKLVFVVHGIGQVRGYIDLGIYNPQKSLEMVAQLPLKVGVMQTAGLLPEQEALQLRVQQHCCSQHA